MDRCLTARDGDLAAAVRQADAGDPLRVLASACLGGARCTWDGAPCGSTPGVEAILALANVRAVPVCPEDLAFGTPRALCDLHGGDGFDAWEGRARVLTEEGVDWTAPLLASCEALVARAREDRIELALLLDMSARAAPG